MAPITLVDPKARDEQRLTKAEAARQLGMTPHLVGRLVEGGWSDLSTWQVQALAARKFITTTDPIAVLRMGPPKLSHEVESDGTAIDRPIGASASYDDITLLEAARRWWRCDPDDVLASGVVLVTCAGFVVATMEMLEVEDEFTEGTVRRYAFTARLLGRVEDLPENRVRHLVPNLVNAALGHRLPRTPQGRTLVVERLYQ